MPSAPPRVYLAGPEVFHPKARELGAEKCRLCQEAGLEGVFPLDAELDLVGLPPAEKARRIALANEALIRSCDAMIANLTPFRGVSMDAGTAFEIGFMRALSRPVFGYTGTALEYASRSRTFRREEPLPFDIDRPGLEIEDFGLAENLMLDVAVNESGAAVLRTTATSKPTLEDMTVFKLCLIEAARHLQAADEDTPENT